MDDTMVLDQIAAVQAAILFLEALKRQGNQATGASWPHVPAAGIFLPTAWTPSLGMSGLFTTPLQQFPWSNPSFVANPFLLAQYSHHLASGQPLFPPADCIATPSLALGIAQTPAAVFTSASTTPATLDEGVANQSNADDATLSTVSSTSVASNSTSPSYTPNTTPSLSADSMSSQSAADGSILDTATQISASAKYTPTITPDEPGTAPSGTSTPSLSGNFGFPSHLEVALKTPNTEKPPKLTIQQTEMLDRYYKRNHRPSPKEKEVFLRNVNCTDQQLSWAFRNRRAREKKKLKKGAADKQNESKK